MKRDGFLRCYFEAWVYWIARNLIGAVIGWLSIGVFKLPTVPPSQLALWLEPGALVAQSVMIIPLFAAILVGSRRSIGRDQ